MQTFQEFSEKLLRSISVKIAIIGFLILILLIPTILIRELIGERQRTRDSVVQEVSDKWGRAQTVSGPVMAIPYFELHQNGEGEIVKTSKTLFVLPEKLDISGQDEPRDQAPQHLQGDRLSIGSQFQGCFQDARPG